MATKIFFPTQVFFPSQAGGPANTIYWLAKSLFKQGFAPLVVSSDKGVPPGLALNRWLDVDCGRAIYVKTRIDIFPLRQTLVALGNFHRADIVQLSNIFYPAVFTTAFAARLFGKKLVWSPRGDLDPQSLIYSPARKRPVLWGIKNFVSRYATFHTTCDAETEYVKNLFGARARCVQIPNYIELPAAVRREAKKYFLYIGRIHPKKAIDNLIESLALSKEFLRSDFVFKIAGKSRDNYDETLRKLVGELNLSAKVEFVGQIEGAAKQQLLADARFTFMPSHTENFGVVALESLAQSTPVVASRGTPWESLEIEKVGFWTENSPENLASAIDKILLMDEDEYDVYRRRAREFVERDFDIEKNIGKWLELYRNL